MAKKKAEVVAESEEVEVSAEDQALADAQTAVAEAAAAHAESQAALDEAKANLGVVVTAREGGALPVYGKDILVSFKGATGPPVVRPAPKDWERDKPRALLVDGVNVEHVSDVKTDDGDIWVYRQM